MLQNTRGIVLRSVKYGETSLICTLFTEYFGIQSYLVKGVRTSGARSSRAGLLQPTSLLEIVAWQKPQQSLQHLREYQPAYIYTSLHEEVIKNSIGLFSVELLTRLLPEHAPMPELFDFTFSYFTHLDILPNGDVANFPLYFILQCSRFLGYELKGSYSAETPHLNLHEGGFTDHPPLVRPFVSGEDAQALAKLLMVDDLPELKDIEMGSKMRFRLLDWYLEFLHRHTEHLGPIRTLAVLQAILH